MMNLRSNDDYVDNNRAAHVDTGSSSSVGTGVVGRSHAGGSSGGSSINREVLHIALGHDACTLSSYWMYLQGLAGSCSSTTSTTANSSNGNNNDDATTTNNNINNCYFNINITHGISTVSSCRSSASLLSNSSSSSYYYTPRALFVDHDSYDSYNEPKVDQDSSTENDTTATGTLPPPTTSLTSTSITEQQKQQQRQQQQTQTNSSWNGFTIQTFNRRGDVIDTTHSPNYFLNPDGVGDSSNNTNTTTGNTSVNSTLPLNNDYYWDSRYVVQSQQSTLSSSVSQQQQQQRTMYTNVSADGRCVVWDDDDDDMEKEEDMDNYDDDRYNNEQEYQYNNIHSSNNSSIQQQHQYQQMMAVVDSSIIKTTTTPTPTPTPTPVVDSIVVTCTTSGSTTWRDVIKFSPYNSEKTILLVPSYFIPNNINDPNNNYTPATTSSGSTTSNGGGCGGDYITYHQAASRGINGTNSNSSSNRSNSFTNWMDNSLMDDKVRHLLESCDSCQGIIIVNDAIVGSSSGSANAASTDSFYSGIGTSLLYELYDECSSAGRWNISIDGNSTCSSQIPTSTSTGTTSFVPNPPSTYQRLGMVQMAVERGLALHTTMEYSDAYLPLQLPYCDDTAVASPIQSIVRAAVALETCTIPYRLQSSVSSSSSPLIGLNGLHYYGNGSNDSSYFPFGTTTNMNFKEYIKSLQSQSSIQSRKVWELDVYMNSNINNTTNTNTKSLWLQLMDGTSLDRDYRMRSNNHSSSSSSVGVLPGSWMLDSTFDGGLLTSYSPSLSLKGKNCNVVDRSVHHHFALSASIRPSDVPTGTLGYNSNMKKRKEEPTSPLTISQQYVSVMMQGMGIRYHPEQSVASFVPQSISELLRASSSSSGSLRQRGGRVPPTPVPPLLRPMMDDTYNDTSLGVLGNTTRRFGYLNGIASEFKSIFQPGTISRGLYNRQVAMDLLPAEDDCYESIEACLVIRDAYEPPDHQSTINNNSTCQDE